MISDQPGRRLRLAAVVLVALPSGALLLGAFLDAVANAAALPVEWRQWGTALLLGLTLLLDILLRLATPAWANARSHFRFTRLGPVPWAGVFGAAILLWIPRIVPWKPTEQTVEHKSLADLLPLFVGASWRYGIADMQQRLDAGTNVYRSLGAYTESISFLRSDIAPTVSLAELTRSGDVPEILLCKPSIPRWEIEATDADVKAGLRSWIVTNGTSRFEECNEATALGIAGALASGEKPGASVVPDYVGPFEVGSQWGLDAETPPRSDGYYQWRVEGTEDVRVPAGVFKSCFKLAYRTNPNHQIKWICAGVGLVAWEYGHHGSVTEYRAELIEWQSSPKR